MKQKVAIEIISSLLILLFVYAASSKLIEYSIFKTQLMNQLFFKTFAGLIAWLVLSIELLTALLLTVKVTRIIGLYASLIMLLIFILYIAGMLLSGKQLPCSCGGIIQQLSWKQHLIFNLFFLLLSFAGIVLGRKQKLSKNDLNKTA